MDTADLARLEQDEQLQLQRQRHGRDRDPHAQSQALAQAEIAGVAGSTSADALAGLSAADYDPDEDDPLNDDRRERERLFLGAAQQGRDVSRTTATAAAALGADAGARPVEQIIRVPAAALPPDASNGGDDEEDDEDDMFVVKKKKPRLTDPAALERELEEGAKAKVAFVPVRPLLLLMPTYEEHRAETVIRMCYASSDDQPVSGRCCVGHRRLGGGPADCRQL
jgi:hypothetical protein